MGLDAIFAKLPSCRAVTVSLPLAPMICSQPCPSMMENWLSLSLQTKSSRTTVMSTRLRPAVHAAGAYATWLPAFHTPACRRVLLVFGDHVEPIQGNRRCLWGLVLPGKVEKPNQCMAVCLINGWLWVQPVRKKGCRGSWY